MSDSLHTPKTLLQKRKEPEIFLLTDTFALSHPICQIYVIFVSSWQIPKPNRSEVAAVAAVCRSGQQQV